VCFSLVSFVLTRDVFIFTFKTELLKALQKGESDLIIYQTPSAIKDFDSFAEK